MTVPRRRPREAEGEGAPQRAQLLDGRARVRRETWFSATHSTSGSWCLSLSGWLCAPRMAIASPSAGRPSPAMLGKTQHRGSRGSRDAADRELVGAKIAHFRRIGKASDLEESPKLYTSEMLRPAEGREDHREMRSGAPSRQEQFSPQSRARRPHFTGEGQHSGNFPERPTPQA